MLIPTRTLPPNRALLGLGAMLLRILEEPKPVSKIWDDYKRAQAALPDAPTPTFGWFVLGLDLLFILGLIRYDHNRLVKTADDQAPVQ